MSIRYVIALSSVLFLIIHIKEHLTADRHMSVVFIMFVVF